MKGPDFLEQCRRELEASAEREKLVSLLLAVEQLVGETPGCDVDGQKTLKELYGKMAEFAQKNQKTGYTVWDTKRGKTFATSDEAIAYANERRQRTGEIFTVTQTRKAVTHTYAGRPQKKK